MSKKQLFNQLIEGQLNILQQLQKLAANPKPNTVLYTFDDLAKIFKVTKRTIYNWKDEGRLPLTIIGSKTYMTEAQLQEFLTTNSIKGR